MQFLLPLALDLLARLLSQNDLEFPGIKTKMTVAMNIETFNLLDILIIISGQFKPFRSCVGAKPHHSRSHRSHCSPNSQTLKRCSFNFWYVDEILNCDLNIKLLSSTFLSGAVYYVA